MVAAYPLADRSPESLAEDVIRYGAAGYTLLKVARDPDRARMRRLLETARGAAHNVPAGRRRGYGWRSSAEALAELPTGATRHSPGSRTRSSRRTRRAAQRSGARAAIPWGSETR